MRSYLFLALALVISASSPAQGLSSKFKKITTGMTMQEVKAILGKPTTIRIGFPKMIYSNGEIEMRGQAWYTSWFYYQPPKNDVVNLYIVIFEKSSNLVTETKTDQVLGSLLFKDIKE